MRRGQLELLGRQARLLSSPRGLLGSTRDAQRAAAALGHAFAAAAPRSPLNQPSSSLRHLPMLSRPLSELRDIKQRHGTTINDVVLAVCAGAVRLLLQHRGEQVVALKAMVPVSVRGDDDGAVLGNRIAFMFIELPCDEPDPVIRLLAIKRHD